MGKYSFIGDLVSNGSKAAKEVVEGTGKSANSRAKMIKNCVNNVQSNLGGGQAKAISELGESSSRALKEGIDNSVKQVQERTAQKALNKTISQNGTPTQISKDFINNKTTNRAIQVNATGNSAVDTALNNVRSKRVNQIIDGHNAKQRDVEMQTIVNNVKDRNINRVPKGHETAREAVENANAQVRNAKNINPDNVEMPHGANWINDTTQQMPINNYTQPNTGPQASPIIKNSQNTNTTGNTAQQRYYRTQPEVEPEFDTSGGGNGSGGGGGNKSTTEGPETSGPNNNRQKNNKTRERMNREFNDKFGDFKEGAKDTFLGGILDSYDNIRHGEQGILEGIKNAHINDDGSMNWRRAAGTFMTASAAARVASGGGLYKDRYGNPNLIGVPFI